MVCCPGCRKDKGGGREARGGDRPGERAGRDAGGDRAEEGRGQHSGRPPRPGGGPDGRQRRRGDPLGRPGDAVVLRGAAAALNEFASDGSFLERFATGGEGGEGAGEPDQAAPPDHAQQGLRPDQLAQLDDEDPTAPRQALAEDGQIVTEPGAARHVSGASQAGALAGNAAAAAALRARLQGAFLPFLSAPACLCSGAQKSSQFFCTTLLCLYRQTKAKGVSLQTQKEGCYKMSCLVLRRRSCGAERRRQFRRGGSAARAPAWRGAASHGRRCSRRGGG